MNAKGDNLMETQTPDTLNYLIMGLVATFGTLALLIGSFIARERNLRKDIDLINKLNDDN